MTLYPHLFLVQVHLLTHNNVDGLQYFVFVNTERQQRGLASQQNTFPLCFGPFDMSLSQICANYAA